jgi:hypothetical protein
VFAALVFNVLYLAGQMGAVAVIYGYAHLVEKGTQFKVPGTAISIEPNGPELIWIVVSLSALLLLASGLFQYASRRIVCRIVEDYLADSLKELIVAEARLPDPRARMASRMLLQHGFYKILGGSRRNGLIAVIFFNASVGAIGAVTALAFLFAVEPLLTFMILLGVVLGALTLYPIALRGVRFAKMREQTQAALNRDLRELFESGLGAELGHTLSTPREFAYAYMGRRRVVAEFTFVIGAALTVILAMVVYYVAEQALDGSASWATFIAYVGALRLVLAGCSQLIRAFAGVSRFYPQLVPYYAFVQDYRKIDQCPLATVKRDERLNLGSQANGENVIVPVGTRIALATADTRHQVKFALLDAKVASSGQPVGTTLFKPGRCVNTEAGLVLVEVAKFDGAPDGAASLHGSLGDRVALIVHRSSSTVGSFAEVMLLTIEHGSIQRFISLDSTECEVIMKEFDRKASLRATDRSFGDDEDDGDV